MVAGSGYFLSPRAFSMSSIDGGLNSLESGLECDPRCLFDGVPVHCSSVSGVCSYASSFECFHILVILIADGLLVLLDKLLLDVLG